MELVGVFEAGPEPVRRLTLDRGDDERYRAAVHGLQTLDRRPAAGGDGRQLRPPHDDADGPRRAPRRRHLGHRGQSDEKLQAAVMLACWGEAFGAIAAAQALADAGLERQRLFFIVLDELWRVLRAGPGLVDRVDALTRLNRQEGVGMAMVFHTLKDLVSLGTEEDRMKAKGFAERAGYLAIAGVPAAELALLEEVVSLTGPRGPCSPAGPTRRRGTPSTSGELEPPGRGRFLLKIGGRPGIPVQMTLVGPELGIHDTNKKWHGLMASRQRFAMTTEAVLGHRRRHRAAAVVVGARVGRGGAGRPGRARRAPRPHNPLRLLGRAAPAPVPVVRLGHLLRGRSCWRDGRCRSAIGWAVVVATAPAPPHRPPGQAAPPRPGWPCAATRDPTPAAGLGRRAARSSAPTWWAGGWCGRRGRTWPWWWPEPGCERPPPG